MNSGTLYFDKDDEQLNKTLAAHFRVVAIQEQRQAQARMKVGRHEDHDKPGTSERTLPRVRGEAPATWD